MTSPLQGGKPDDQRRSTEEKITAVYDLLGMLLKALLGIFGHRHSDK